MTQPQSFARHRIHWRRRAFLGSAAMTGLALAARPVVAQTVGTIRVSRFYDPEDGVNLQPAFQAAIDAAAREGAGRIVNDLPIRRGEMWCPVRRSSDGRATDGIPLVVREPVEIDFAGLEITLKGPGGGRREQIVRGIKGPWLGGWLYVAGHPRFDRIVIANVTVDGGFAGPFDANGRANLTDKGFRIQDTPVREVRMSRVELRNFGGEIYYIGGHGPDWQTIEDCHFHGSPQCAFNPGGTGRLSARGLQAGRAYQAAEIVGGKGHTYEGGRFYDAGKGGVTVFGGPSPGFRAGIPYYIASWDGRGEKPWVTFAGTRFDNCWAVRLGSWMRGRIATIDTVVGLALEVGHVRDIDLAIDSTCDRTNNVEAVSLNGPFDVNERVRGHAAMRMMPPSDIALDVTCRRSPAARAAGRAHSCGIRLFGGRVDAASLDIVVRGEARAATRIDPRKAPGFVAPDVRAEGFTPV